MVKGFCHDLRFIADLLESEIHTLLNLRPTPVSIREARVRVEHAYERGAITETQARRYSGMISKKES